MEPETLGLMHMAFLGGHLACLGPHVTPLRIDFGSTGSQCKMLFLTVGDGKKKVLKTLLLALKVLKEAASREASWSSGSDLSQEGTIRGTQFRRNLRLLPGTESASEQLQSCAAV